jgi:transcriptional regulator with XRE-family HTH domain
VARALEELKFMKDVSTQDIADRAGLSNVTVYAMLRNAVDPRIGTLEEIARVFGMKTSDLIRLGEKNK